MGPNIIHWNVRYLLDHGQEQKHHFFRNPRKNVHRIQNTWHGIHFFSPSSTSFMEIGVMDIFVSPLSRW